MRFAALLGVKDEVELIGPALAHLRAIGVEHVIASDAGSSDGTAEVLAAAARQGGVELMPFDDDAYDDGAAERRSTDEACARARRAGADWLLFLDADEFWLPATGRLADTAGLATARAVTVPRFNVPRLPTGAAISVPATPDRYADILLYAPDEDREVGRARVRGDADSPWIAMMGVAKVMIRPDGRDTTSEGHHGAIDAATGRRVLAAAAADLVIAHVPFTSEARFARKVANIAALVAASGDQWPDTSAWHWKRWLEIIARDGGVGGEVARNTVTPAALGELRRAGVVRSAAELLGPSYRAGAPAEPRGAR